MISVASSHSLPFPLSPLLSCTLYHLLLLEDCDFTLSEPLSPNSLLTLTCSPASSYPFPLSLTLCFLFYSDSTLITFSQPGPDPSAGEPGTHPTVSGHCVLKVEHQGPDDAEEEAKHGESDDPPALGL